MRELVDKEYNIEYSSIIRLKELLAPNLDESDRSDDSMINNPLEDSTLMRSRIE